MGFVDKNRFSEEIYLGLPANFNDKIITRRINIINSIENFYDTKLNCAEIGCGNGATAIRLANYFNSIDCYDIFENNKNEFEKNAQALNVTNCSFLQSDIEKDTITHEKYDRLICFEVIEHFKDDNSVTNLYKMIKKGGKAVISVPNKWWIFETHGAKLPLLPWNRVPFFSWLPKPIHEKFANARIYTKGRIVKLLKNAGFKIEEVKYVTAPMDVLKEGKLKEFLTSTIFKNDTTKIPFFSTSIFIYVSK